MMQCYLRIRVIKKNNTKHAVYIILNIDNLNNNLTTKYNRSVAERQFSL